MTEQMRLTSSIYQNNTTVWDPSLFRVGSQLKGIYKKESGGSG